MIKYVEYLQTNGTKYGWQIPLQVGYNTTIEMDFEPLSGSPNSDGWYNFFLTNGNKSNLTTYYGEYNLNDVGGSFLGREFSPRLSFSSGTRYLFELDNTGARVDNVQVSTVTNVSQSSSSSIIYINSANDFVRSPIAKYYGFKAYDNGTLVFDLRPALDSNDAPCFYEVISETYYYHTKFDSSQGDPTAGPILPTIFVSADKTTMPSSGGTINVTVNSETDWTASTTGSWFTMSSDSGTSADTAITITVPSTTSLTQVQDTITFTNAAGDTDYLAIKQRKYNAGGGTYLMAIGGESVETFYIGGEQVDTIYIGSEIVYQSGPFVGLKMKSSVSLQKGIGETFNLKIRSSEPWTLSVDSNATWLSASTLSGPTGDTTVVLETTSENNTQSARTTVITATTANFSATCEVTQQYFVSNYLFNYNAKEYDASTHSFPKTVGQSFNEDIILNTGVVSASTDYAHFDGHQWMGKQYSSTDDNPFNRGNDGKDLTFIYKAAFGNSGTMNLFSNRGGNYNWMVRKSAFHTSSEIMQFTPSEEPCTIVITVDSNGNGERKCIETNQSATATNVTYGNPSDAIGFFSGYGNKQGETFYGDFYWMFMATRKLTDDEINTVIYYNEHLNDEPPTPTGSTGTLSISVGNSIEDLVDEGWEGACGTHYTITLSGQSSDVAGFAYLAMDQMSYDGAIENEEDPDSLEYFIANANYTNEDSVTEVLEAEGTYEDGFTLDIVFIKAYAIDSNNDLIESISAITEDIHLTREAEGGEE